MYIFMHFLYKSCNKILYIYYFSIVFAKLSDRNTKIRFLTAEQLF